MLYIVRCWALTIKRKAIYYSKVNFPFYFFSRAACEQTHLWVKSASGEEQSEPSGRSLVKKRQRKWLSLLASPPLDFALDCAQSWACKFRTKISDLIAETLQKVNLLLQNANYHPETISMCRLKISDLGKWRDRRSKVSRFQFHQDRGLAWKPAKADVASSLNIVIYYISVSTSVVIGQFYVCQCFVIYCLSVLIFFSRWKQNCVLQPADLKSHYMGHCHDKAHVRSRSTPFFVN